MADSVSALVAAAPDLQVASRLTARRLPVLPAFEHVLPHGGLQPGTTIRIAGLGATSLALALVARASVEAWTAIVGIPALGLRAAAELGVDLDRLVVVPDPATQWDAVLASLVDAFDMVVAHQPAQARARRLAARVREHDAVLLVVGSWQESDLAIEGTASTWHGIDGGHGHLRARTLTVCVSGRGAASHPRRTTLWLPDRDGDVSVVDETKVVAIRRTG